MISIELNTYFMALVFIIFLAVLFMLNNWVFRPIINFMEKREENNLQKLQEIADFSTDIADIKKEAEEILESARIEAKNMIHAAITDAKLLYKSKEDKHREALDLKMKEYLSKLEREKEEIKKELLSPSNRSQILESISRKTQEF